MCGQVAELEAQVTGSISGQKTVPEMKREIELSLQTLEQLSAQGLSLEDLDHCSDLAFLPTCTFRFQASLFPCTFLSEDSVF